MEKGENHFSKRKNSSLAPLAVGSSRNTTYLKAKKMNKSQLVDSERNKESQFRDLQVKKMRKKIAENSKKNLPKVWNKQIVDCDSVDSDERFAAYPPSPGIAQKIRNNNLYRLRPAQK